MVDNTITTTVDSLIDLLKTVNRIEVEKAAKKLDLSTDVVQSWVDFLVEEKIIGIEYKFTTPYIYLNKPKEEVKEDKEQEKSLSEFRKDFENRAKEKKISQEKTKDLWKNHLVEKLDKKKDFFFQEARKRGFFNPEELWEDYKKNLLKLYYGH